MKSAVACGAVILTLVGCTSLLPTEQKLIGTWTITAAIKYHEDGSEEFFEMAPDMEITLTKDHRELWSYPGQAPHAIGWWRLDGHDLLFTIVSKPKDMDLPSTPKRERIVRVSDTELVFTDGKAGGRWKRIR